MCDRRGARRGRVEAPLPVRTAAAGQATIARTPTDSCRHPILQKTSIIFRISIPPHQHLFLVTAAHTPSSNVFGHFMPKLSPCFAQGWSQFLKVARTIFFENIGSFIA